MREMQKLLESGLQRVNIDENQLKGAEAGSDGAAACFEKQDETSQASLVTFSRQKLALLSCEYDPKRCSGCNKVGAALKRCVKCKTAYYCSKQCQGKDWGERHKTHCKEIRRLQGNLQPRTLREDVWLLSLEVTFYPRMCLWEDNQIVKGIASWEDITSVIFYSENGEKLSGRSFPWQSIVRGPCVCHTNTGKYIALAITPDDESQPVQPDRIEMYTFDLKLHYTYTGEKNGCFGTLDYFDGLLLVCNDKSKILMFDVSSFPITPAGNPIPIGFTVRSICSTFLKSTKVIIMTHEDKEGFYTMTCINYSGDKLWQLGGLFEGGMTVDNTMYLSKDDLRLYAKEWQKGGMDDRFLPDDACVDDRGYIFAANPASLQVVVIKEDLIPKAVFQAPGRVWCVKWSETTKKLYVIHINETRTSLLMTVLDVSGI